MSTRYVALLRGINVGGNNQVPMKVLARLFSDAGCSEVSTYIQSGNVLFSASPKRVKGVPGAIERALWAKLGVRAPVVVRSAAELDAVLAGNPFLAEGASEEALYVMFLADPPSASDVTALDPERSRPDRFEVRGSEIFLLLPNGAARSKLTNAYFDARLKTVSTSRNWRTVRGLRERLGG